MSSFVSFGNLPLPFPRMVKAIEFSYYAFPKPLIIQAGHNIDLFSTPPGNVRIFKHCTYSEFNAFVRDAEVMVTHGGVGSIQSAILAGLKPAVFVRRGDTGEHIDNHQVEWCELLSQLGFIAEIANSDALLSFLNNRIFSQSDHIAVRSFFDNSSLEAAVLDQIKEIVYSRRHNK